MTNCHPLGVEKTLEVHDFRFKSIVIFSTDPSLAEIDSKIYYSTRVVSVVKSTIVSKAGFNFCGSQKETATWL